MTYTAPRGSLPVLQYCTPAQLAIDTSYQRELDRDSRHMIDRIAREWDWGLCQPLVVACREPGVYFVIDGQHRLAAARQRGDIAQLPCVVLYPGDRAAEAATFVKLNAERRPLTAFALWNAALCAGDEHALALQAIMQPMGISFSGAADPAALKPRQFNNVATIRKWHVRHGDANTRAVLGAIVTAYPDVALQIAGSLFFGTAAALLEHGAAFDPTNFARMLRVDDQAQWLKFFRAHAANHGVGLQAAAVAVIGNNYRETLRAARPAPVVPESTNPPPPRTGGRIDLNAVPSAMEQRAASWSKTA